MATDLNEKTSDTSLYEVDKLLKLAEDLQEKCQRHQREIFFQNMAAVVAIVTGAVLSNMTFAVLVRDPIWATHIGPAFSMALAAALLLVGIISYFWNGPTRALHTDRRAMHSIVDMLRETEKSIVDSHQTTALEREEIRIRLSRFDIGPGGEPGERRAAVGE